MIPKVKHQLAASFLQGGGEPKKWYVDKSQFASNKPYWVIIAKVPVWINSHKKGNDTAILKFHLSEQ